jgi:copper chaperone
MAAKEIAMETVTLKVQGMTCQGCVRSVKKVLEGVPGVDQAEVSLERAEAQVRFDPASASPARLAQAVQDAGYQAQA